MSQRPKRTTNAERPQQYRRQILAGNHVEPSPDPWARSGGKLPMTVLQRNFLIIAVILLAIGGGLLLADQVMLATIPLFLLALVLITGRFVF